METTLIDLKTRRSVRSYTDRPIDEKTLAQIAEAGTYAPTGMGRQSPKIVVITNPAVRNRLEKLNAAVMGNPEGKPFYGAPVVMVVLADPEIPTYFSDGNLVMGNLINAAHALGVDSCYIYRATQVFDSREGKALLKEWGIDEKYRGIGNCILGYGDQPTPEPKPRKSDYTVFIR